MFWKRKPDFVIAPTGEPAMNRWHLIPRNRFLSVYLHNLLKDDSQDLHDHRSWNISIVLKGGYWEIVAKEPPHRLDAHVMAHPSAKEYSAYYREQYAKRFQAPFKAVWRGPGSIIFRRATDAHRLELDRGAARTPGRPALLEPVSSWSIFITGPTWRTWGFWLKTGWVPFKEYVTVKDGVSVGKNASKPGP